MRVGEFTSRIGDAVKIRSFVNNVVVDLCVNVLKIIFNLAMMLNHSWQLALILIASIPAYSILFYLVDILRNCGAEIVYSRTNHTFYYIKGFELEISLKVKNRKYEKWQDISLNLD